MNERIIKKDTNKNNDNGTENKELTSDKATEVAVRRKTLIYQDDQLNMYYRGFLR